MSKRIVSQMQMNVTVRAAKRYAARPRPMILSACRLSFIVGLPKKKYLFTRI
jgi:hypothetical protein